ncbi:NAD(P)-dependent alcohol dehydrogenase [Variovorax rhizosphaerae]|uniref:NAD(P)-dependent alcohol dehydrogenase n=1 Tax=Variovorax rhizosphaerae TaxID=1836200 RepID=A0ABU8WL04_9BURK
MFRVKARCTCGPRQPFVSTTIERRAPGPRDVHIAIAYAGICQSDVEHAHSTRGKTIYPLVPGHEMAGTVLAVGSEVTRHRVGDRVGVGNMVDACRRCDNCRAGLEQYCSGGRTLAYGVIGADGQPTYGGYSEQVVVDEAFVVAIPDAIALQNAAPLLCAGITMYSPLRHWGAGPGKRVAILGFGGLGHMGVQISRSLGAHTTVLDITPAKREDALRLGADDYRLSNEPDTFTVLDSSFDIVLSTVPIHADLDRYLGLLALDGVYVNLAVASVPLSVPAAALLTNRRSIAGTRSGGIAETQEMLDFCAAHGIAAEVEVIAADDIDAAYRRLLAGDVRFRFVIDNQTL